MITKRPRRLDGVSDVGFQRYFLTICTAHRRQMFTTLTAVDGPLGQLRKTCALFDFALVAYCFMPDHLHALIAAESEQADLGVFVKRFTQMTGFAHRRSHRDSLSTGVPRAHPSG